MDVEVAWVYHRGKNKCSLLTKVVYNALAFSKA